MAAFGVQYNGASMASVIGPLDFAERTEALGYRSFFVPELETLPTLDAFTLLASVAQRTTHMRLGTGVAVLPFHTPYQIAKIETSIDVLSSGRMVPGLGSGGVYNDDFGVEGVRVEDRRGITDERLALVRRLLSETDVTHHGTFHSMEHVTLERTARWADGFHPNGMTPRGYAEGKAAIEEMAAAFGRDPAAFEWSCNMYLCMGQTKDDAHSEVQAAMRHRFGDDAWAIDPETLPLGTPSDCIETLEAFVDAGVTHFIINALCTPEALLPTYDRFAAEVMPHFGQA